MSSRTLIFGEGRATRPYVKPSLGFLARRAWRRLLAVLGA